MYQDGGFYFLWFLFFLFFGLFIILPCETVKGRIIAIIVSLAFAFCATVISYKQSEGEINQWNEGICKCGGTYEFTAAAKSAMSTTYYYTCDTCGHTEEFDHIMK